MTTADNMVPVLCALARHHTGDHSEHGAHRAARVSCGHVIRYEERVAEEVCPPVEPEAIGADGHNHVSEIFTPMTCPGCAAQAKENPPAGFFPPPTPPAPVPAEPPPLADLIADVMAVSETIAVATQEAEQRERELASARHVRWQAENRLAVAQSNVAKRIGKGKLVQIGATTFQAVPPRKPKGGEVAADALWRLEPVEVAK